MDTNPCKRDSGLSGKYKGKVICVLMLHFSIAVSHGLEQTHFQENPFWSTTFESSSKSVFYKEDAQLYCGYISSKNIVLLLSVFQPYCWFGGLSLGGKLLGRCTTRSFIGINVTDLSRLYVVRATKEARVMPSDPSHPPVVEFQSLPSGRRYALPKRTTTRWENSFVPASISFINNKCVQCVLLMLNVNDVCPFV